MHRNYVTAASCRQVTRRQDAAVTKQSQSDINPKAVSLTRLRRKRSTLNLIAAFQTE
jgi:hypothetical protein